MKLALQMYEKFVELGVVMRQMREDRPIVPGFLKPVGKKWDWRLLFKQSWNNDPEWDWARSTKERVQLLQRKIAEAQ